MDSGAVRAAAETALPPPPAPPPTPLPSPALPLSSTSPQLSPLARFQRPPFEEHWHLAVSFGESFEVWGPGLRFRVVRVWGFGVYHP